MRVLIALAAAAAIVCTVSTARAFDCPDEKTVYVADEKNLAYTPSDRPPPRMSFRLSIDDKLNRVLDLTTDGVKERYYLVTGGTGVQWSVAKHADGRGDDVIYRPLDLSSIAKRSAPDRAVLFDDTLFWPRCVQ